MLQIGRRLGPHVDNDVPNRPCHAPNKLGFSHGRSLVMHSPDGPFALGVGQARLGYFTPQPLFGEFLLAKRAREEAARIVPAIQIDNESTVEFGLLKNHSGAAAAGGVDFSAAQAFRPKVPSRKSSCRSGACGSGIRAA